MVQRPLRQHRSHLQPQPYPHLQLEPHQRGAGGSAPPERELPSGRGRRLPASLADGRGLHPRPVPPRAEPHRRPAQGDVRRQRHSEPAELHLRQPHRRRRRRGLGALLQRQPHLDQGQPRLQGRGLLRAPLQHGRQGLLRARFLRRPVRLHRGHQQPARHRLLLRQRAPRELPELQRDRRLAGGELASLSPGVIPPGHLEGLAPRDPRLRRAPPVVQAVVHEAARRHLRARAL